MCASEGLMGDKFLENNSKPTIGEISFNTSYSEISSASTLGQRNMSWKKKKTVAANLVACPLQTVLT
jgi:hypothetical protein